MTEIPETILRLPGGNITLIKKNLEEVYDKKS